MEVSKYGFADVLVKDIVILDPSRIAAQVVSGIGFLGGGLILVRRGSIQGLTTAAGIWVAAAIGLTAGAGFPLLAIGATAIGLGSNLTFRILELRLRRFRRQNVTEVLVRCRDARGVLASITSTLADEGWDIEAVSFNRNDIPKGLVENRIVMRGGNSRTLVERLASVQGVESIDFLSHGN
jgi:putative Mg2+ transporter-C (MgtC) family protein